MKNLKKLSKKELRTIQGAIEKCRYLANGEWFCPCNIHTHYNCFGTCIPIGTACAEPPIQL